MKTTLNPLPTMAMAERIAGIEADLAVFAQRLDQLHLRVVQAVLRDQPTAESVAVETPQRSGASGQDQAVVQEPLAAVTPQLEHHQSIEQSHVASQELAWPHLRSIMRWSKRLFLGSFVWSCLFGDPSALPWAIWDLVRIPYWILQWMVS